MQSYYCQQVARHESPVQVAGWFLLKIQLVCSQLIYTQLVNREFWA